MSFQRHGSSLVFCTLPRTGRITDANRSIPPQFHPLRYFRSSKSTHKLSPEILQYRGGHERLAVIQDNDEFHRFTRGRFVTNESHEMTQRYVSFDLNELAKAAAKALNSRFCIRVTKYPDGMHSKALLLVTDDGKECVVKIPNPNAGPAHFTTASEVATMDFMRNILGTPTPKVYAWCSKAEETAVRAEFIIMEKMNGKPLDLFWEKMDVKDQFTVTKAIASYQLNWTNATFKGYGGIYYQTDLDDNTPSIPCEHGLGQFAIGPTTGREWTDDQRQSVKFDRGPWRTVSEYLTAVGRREATCVENLESLCKSPIALYGPGTYLPTREKKLNALEYYLALTPYLCPDDSTITKPCIWHGDLHIENIFVDPADPTKITGMIDWQSTEIVPTFRQARQPFFLDLDGPQPKGLERPRLPPNIEELSVTEQENARLRYFKHYLIVLYRKFIHGTNPKVWECFEFQETPAFSLLLLARRLLVDGEATFMAQALELTNASQVFDQVDERTRQKYLNFTASERARIQEDVEVASYGMDIMQGIKDALGDLFPERGVVRHEQYDECKHALRQVKEQVIAQFARNDEEKEAWMRAWPFDD